MNFFHSFVTVGPDAPFVVRSDEAYSRVLGTKFLVQAWPDESRNVEVIVEEGKIVSEFEDHSGATAIKCKDPRLFYSVFQDGDPFTSESTYDSGISNTGYNIKKGILPVDPNNGGTNFPIIRYADVC